MIAIYREISFVWVCFFVCFRKGVSLNGLEVREWGRVVIISLLRGLLFRDFGLVEC